MSRIKLRLYRPPEEPAAADEELRDIDRPRVLRFRRHGGRTVISGRYTHPEDRARTIRDNRICPACESIDVEPLELEDGLVSARSHLPIPGTATIVGFHCNHCAVDWPVYDLVSRRHN